MKYNMLEVMRTFENSNFVTIAKQTTQIRPEEVTKDLASSGRVRPANEYNYYFEKNRKMIELPFFGLLKKNF